MADTFQIRCIKKSDLDESYKRITHIGGTNMNGAQWKIAEADAIAGIEAGRWRFYISVNGMAMLVVVGVSTHGHKYLKGESDGELPTHLLNLQECPLWSGHSN